MEHADLSACSICVFPILAFKKIKSTYRSRLKSGFEIKPTHVQRQSFEHLIDYIRLYGIQI